MSKDQVRKIIFFFTTDRPKIFFETFFHTFPDSLRTLSMLPIALHHNPGSRFNSQQRR